MWRCHVIEECTLWPKKKKKHVGMVIKLLPNLLSLFQNASMKQNYFLRKNYFFIFLNRSNLLILKIIFFKKIKYNFNTFSSKKILYYNTKYTTNPRNSKISKGVSKFWFRRVGSKIWLKLSIIFLLKKKKLTNQKSFQIS